MLLKYYICSLLPCLSVVFASSLTFIVDTTKSMKYELEVIQNAIPKFIEDVMSKKSIDEFVLLKFNDPAVELYITNNKIGFVTNINELTTEGGGECPENSLSAIKKALEISQHNSLLYVMTDAYAQDSNELYNIKELCKKTGSRGEYPTDWLHYLVGWRYLFFDQNNSQPVGHVFIFLSGTCMHNGTEEMSPEHLSVYKEITKYCSGKLKVTNEEGFKEGFKYEETEAESILSDFDPKNEIESVEDLSQECSEEKPPTDCLKQLFYFGVPFWPIRNDESDCKPPMLSAQDVYIIQEITKQVFDEYIKCKNINVKECPKQGRKCKPNSPSISSTCPSGTSGTSGPSGPIIIPEKPQTEISELNNEVAFGADVTIICKVTGVPQPAITWKSDGGKAYKSSVQKLNSQPNTYIKKLYLTNVTESRSYTCQAENKAGTSTATIDIEVKSKNRFEIISTPTDQTVQIYTEAYLSCEADAFPAASVEWYLNDTSIYYDNNLEIDESKLKIKNMTTNVIGNYTCVISNDIASRKFSAFVYIAGLEKPTVNIDLDEIKAKPGQAIEVICSASGKPVPEVKWSFKSKDGYGFNYLPTGMYTSEGKLYTDNVKLTHQGVYRCSVDHYLGYTYDDITLTIGAPPVIENSDQAIYIVEETHRANLECIVHSDLPVKVTWEILNGDGSMKFNANHSTDETYTYSFIAMRTHTGTYRCIAENEAGVTKKVINVDVYVPPYIRPTAKSYKLKSGCNVTFPCVIEYGNPIPNVHWEHTSYHTRVPRVTVLTPGPNNALTLVDVHKSNQGIYSCIAKNKVGWDTIKIDLKVY